VNYSGQVSVSRLGDILNSPTESAPQNLLTLPPLSGAIEFRNVTMRYRPDAPDALPNVSLSIGAGEVIGVVGHSGSGKSTLTKLMQRLYSPQAGQAMIDGVDAAHSIRAGSGGKSASCCRRTSCSIGRSTSTSLLVIRPCHARW
jgi:ABC-type bacteriocin/lantibiotic exporter with double-glycine peptidase domain